jgi:hypothetical protein
MKKAKFVWYSVFGVTQTLARTGVKLGMGVGVVTLTAFIYGSMGTIDYLGSKYGTFKRSVHNGRI